MAWRCIRVFAGKEKIVQDSNLRRQTAQWEESFEPITRGMSGASSGSIVKVHG